MFLLKLWGQKERQTRCFPGLASSGCSDTQEILEAGPDSASTLLSSQLSQSTLHTGSRAVLGNHTLTMMPPVPTLPVTPHFRRGRAQAPRPAFPLLSVGSSPSPHLFAPAPAVLTSFAVPLRTTNVFCLECSPPAS